MPFYYSLRRAIRNPKERARVIGKLRELQGQLDADVPSKDADSNVLIATFNIRDFGAPGTRRGFGKRQPESFFYIAEILSRFDFIAVQEVNELDEWEEVMDILGPDWDYIATDVTDRSLGGNGERLLYCFDKRKMWFKRIAGEIVLPTKMLISKALVTTEEGKKLHAGKQFRRTPFVTSFQSGWFKFDICTVHIFYGEESGPKLEERVEEIDRVAKYFGKRAQKALKEGKSLILLGDFNVVHPDHETMSALVNNDFTIPSVLKKPTNLGRDKYYDQIAFMTKPDVIEYIEKRSPSPKNRNAGIFEIFGNLYKDSEWEDYKSQMKKSPNGKNKSDSDLKKYFKSWRTYQLSDHKLMWVRINSNDSAAYLERLKKEALNQ